MFQCFKYPGYPTTVNPGTPTPTSTQPPGKNNLRFCQSAIILNIPMSSGMILTEKTFINSLSLIWYLD